MRENHRVYRAQSIYSDGKRKQSPSLRDFRKNGRACAPHESAPINDGEFAVVRASKRASRRTDGRDTGEYGRWRSMEMGNSPRSAPSSRLQKHFRSQEQKVQEERTETWQAELANHV